MGDEGAATCDDPQEGENNAARQEGEVPSEGPARVNVVDAKKVVIDPAFEEVEDSPPYEDASERRRSVHRSLRPRSI